VRAVVAALVAVALLTGAAVAVAATGQSPDCRRFCVSVEPRSGPEGSVFRFSGRGWRPERRVNIWFGMYCRPDEACPAIAYIDRVRTNRHGRWSGSRPTFSQRVGKREVTRSPDYRVELPPG
jgi:hypothetical protein